MLTRIYIRKNELGLVLLRGDFETLLQPGFHWIWRQNRQVQVIDRTESQWRDPNLEERVLESELKEQLHILDLKDDERALVWRNGRLFCMLPPGLHAFWRAPHQIQIERFSISENRIFEHAQIDAILQLPEARHAFKTVIVEPYQQLIAIRDGQIESILGPGKYVFWQGEGVLRHELIDNREQTMDIAGQEIMTRDKVSLRLNLVLSYRVRDARACWMEVTDYQQALYREAQLHLRATVGTRDLESLLGDKESVGSEVRDSLTEFASKMGVEVTSLGLRDIILPGDMKAILNQVTEAQKQAEANLIKRREETAAARSQANTAKLMMSNPVLLKLKELETLQEILTNSKATFHIGKGDLVEQLGSMVNLLPTKPSPE